MNLSESIKRVYLTIGDLTERKAPEILAALGVASFIAGVIETAKSAPKAEKKIEEKKEELEVEELSVGDTVKTTWKLYLKPVAYCFAGVCFVIASVDKSNKRYLALSASYKLIEEASKAYKDKVIETVGVRKEKSIRDEIAQDNIDKNPPTEQTIILTNNGNTLFQDSLTGQYFRSDINRVKGKAVDLGNEQLSSHDNYIRVEDALNSLSDGNIDVPPSYSTQGWSMIHQGKALTIDFSAVKARKFNDEPCLVINYYPMPIDDMMLYFG